MDNRLRKEIGFIKNHSSKKDLRPNLNTSSSESFSSFEYEPKSKEEDFSPYRHPVQKREGRREGRRGVRVEYRFGNFFIFSFVVIKLFQLDLSRKLHPAEVLQVIFCNPDNTYLRSTANNMSRNSVVTMTCDHEYWVLNKMSMFLNRFSWINIHNQEMS